MAAFECSKGAYKYKFFSRACCDRSRASGSKLKETRPVIRMKLFYSKGGETLAHVVDPTLLQPFKVRWDRALRNLL